MAPQIFVSYSHQNTAFAKKLFKDLEREGYDIWLDSTDIQTGARWDDEIVKGLDASQVFMILLSKTSAASQNVKDEIGYALDRNLHIIPILIEPCEVPFRLRRVQYVDFTTLRYEEGIKAVLNILRSDLPGAEPQPTKKKKKTTDPAAHSWESLMARKPKDNRSQRQIGGDQNVIRGNISGSGVIVQGRGAQVSVQQNSAANDKELSALFDRLYEAIQTRPPDPNVDKEEISETVQKIEQEVKKGDQANESKLKRWLETLNNMAPDILDVILASLDGPGSGLRAVLKKVAQHARH
jgi:hypothetical protein